MRKLGIFIVGATITLGFFGGNLTWQTASADSHLVYVGGISAGFTLKSGEAQIIGLCDVLTENGLKSPALESGLKTGDRIVKINEIKVESIEKLNELVGKSQGKSVNLEIIRGKETHRCVVTPVKDKTTNKYKLGILARDCVSGIGTVTYIDKKNDRFGALGHAVNGERQAPLSIFDGTVYECSIVGVQKGVRGKAGELRGMFMSEKRVGNAEKLCDCGIFGSVSKEFDYTNCPTAIASSSEVCMGKAWIYSTTNGVNPQKYEIEIVKVDKNNKENKNYVIKITDENLIAETGGIVQGMSGSPIIQEGKMVGAVTHVFLNDPTRGYGIDIETMLRE